MDLVKQLQILAAAAGIMYQKKAVQNRLQVIYGNFIIEGRRKYIIKRKDTSCMSRCILPF